MKNTTPQKLLLNIRPKSLTKSERSVLWQEIQKDITPRTKKEERLFSLAIFQLTSVRMATAAFLIVLLLGGSTVTVLASNEAKPGDLLYPIDIAVEKIQVAVASENKKPLLKVEHAKERFEEVAQLVLLDQFSSEDSESKEPIHDEEDDDEEEGQQEDSREEETTSSAVVILPDSVYTLKDIRRTDKALRKSLRYLEDTKTFSPNEELEGEMDELIHDLTALAQGYVEEIEREREDDNREEREGVREITRDLKREFRLQQKEIRKRDQEEVRDRRDSVQTRKEDRDTQTEEESKEEVKENEHEKEEWSEEQFEELAINVLERIKVEIDKDKTQVKVYWSNGEEEEFVLQVYTVNEIIEEISDFLQIESTVVSDLIDIE